VTLVHPAVAAIAGTEWRRRRRSIVIVGLAAGLVGGLLTGAAALTARTSSAPGRLFSAVDPGDARVQVFGGEALAADIAALDLVTESTGASVLVGRTEGPAVQYVGMASVPPSDLAQPIVIEGRRADADDPSEVLVSERLAEFSDLGPGDILSLTLLTADEVTQFDTGFGEPDGARVDLRITGVARVAPGTFDTAPVMVTPAFADAHEESVAGVDLSTRLSAGADGLPAFREAVDQLVASAPPTAGGEEFVPAVVQDPRDATRALERSSRVLVGALGVVVVVGSLGALLALGQALARHHGASVRAQHVERALGMPPRQRALARAIPWAPAALIAGLGAAALGCVSGALEPVGPLRTIEPSPGYRTELLVVVVGALTTAAAVMGLSFVAALRAGRPVTAPVVARGGRTRLTTIAPRRRGWTLTGAVFALSGSTRGPIRTGTSLAGAIVGIAGLVAGLTFAATLDRVVTTPERYGWTADFVIADVTDETVQRFAADDRFAAVVDILSGSASVNGEVLQAYSSAPVRGVIGWVYVDGRSPQWSGEIALGTKAADSLDVEVGDRVTVDGLGEVEVTGIGVNPPLSGEPFAMAVLLDADAMRDATQRGAVQAVFRELGLRVADPDAREAIIAATAEELEVLERELPQEVQDLADIGRLPYVLGGFLALLGLAAVVHGVVVTTRRREQDLAVLRAVGATPRQSGLAVVAMSLATIVVGLAVGVPLGWALARLVWSILAQSIGIEPGVVLPASVAMVVAGSIVVAGVVAVLPAQRVAALDPATLLRSE
jgi:hypothetical protein